jgi:hypothetical protein
MLRRQLAPDLPEALHHRLDDLTRSRVGLKTVCVRVEIAFEIFGLGVEVAYEARVVEKHERLFGALELEFGNSCEEGRDVPTRPSLDDGQAAQALFALFELFENTQRGDG